MNEFIIKLRDALREELDATNTYDRLREICPEDYKYIIDEIKKDEINHTGRLLDLLLTIDPSQIETFNEGLEQKG